MIKPLHIFQSMILFLLIVVMGCSENKLEQRIKRSHPSHNYKFVTIDIQQLNYLETDYLPVYSDIYFRDGTNRALLTATVSIRNTSLKDSAYLLSSVYYDSYGAKLKEFTDSAILLSPLESIEFVVEEKENAGGVGANFVIEWGTNNYSDQMLIQSVMIGTYGQQGVSFLSEAKIIKKWVKE